MINQDINLIKYPRICPECKKIVFHNSKYTAKYFEGKPCKNCSHIGIKYNIKKRVYTKDELTRKCPTCNNIVIYKNIKTKIRADKENRVCQHCVGKIAIQFKGPMSLEERKKLSIRCKGKTYKDRGINVDLIKRGQKISEAKKGKRFTIQHKIALRKAKLEFNNLYLVHGPSFNPNACKYFDELNKQKGWNLQHALNGGEYSIKNLGYWADAYDKEKNIIVEYDELHHYDKSGNLKLKDVDRMKKIIYTLNCKFLRYNEKTGKLKEYYGI